MRSTSSQAALFLLQGTSSSAVPYAEPSATQHAVGCPEQSLAASPPRMHSHWYPTIARPLPGTPPTVLQSKAIKARPQALKLWPTACVPGYSKPHDYHGNAAWAIQPDTDGSTGTGNRPTGQCLRLPCPCLRYPVECVHGCQQQAHTVGETTPYNLVPVGPHACARRCALTACRWHSLRYAPLAPACHATCTCARPCHSQQPVKPDTHEPPCIDPRRLALWLFCLPAPLQRCPLPKYHCLPRHCIRIARPVRLNQSSHWQLSPPVLQSCLQS